MLITQNKRSVTKSIIIISLIALVLIIFAVWFLYWHQHDAEFNYIISILEDLDEGNVNPRNGNTFFYNDYHNSGYIYSVAKPHFLEFDGNISILTPSNIDFNDEGIANYISEYSIILTYFPKDGRYVLNIAEMPELVGEPVNSLGSTVDNHGQPLNRHSNDSEEFYQEWLRLHEKFNNPITEMFSTIKELFGEDAFK